MSAPFPILKENTVTIERRPVFAEQIIANGSGLYVLRKGIDRINVAGIMTRSCEWICALAIFTGICYTSRCLYHFSMQGRILTI